MEQKTRRVVDKKDIIAVTHLAVEIKLTLLSAFCSIVYRSTCRRIVAEHVGLAVNYYLDRT